MRTTFLYEGIEMTREELENTIGSIEMEYCEALAKRDREEIGRTYHEIELTGDRLVTIIDPDWGGYITSEDEDEEFYEDDEF